MAARKKKDSGRPAPREQGKGRPALRERVLNTLGEVRRQGAALRGGVSRSLVSATDRLKSTQTAEQLGAAVEMRRLIKKAADAQRRGNHAMAYRLLEPEVHEKPDDAKLVVAFWKAAVACERAGDAESAMIGIIRKLAGGGKADRAAELWMELRQVIPSAMTDPNALIRMVPVLQADGRPDQVVEALQEAVDPRNTQLSPGLAVRIAEMARDLDPPTALKAARSALAAPDLHEARRERLEKLVAELESGEAGSASKAAAAAPAAAPKPAPAPAPAPAAQEAPAAAPAAAEKKAPAAAPVAAAKPAPATAPAPAAKPVPAAAPVSAAEEAVVEAAVAAAAPATRFGGTKLTEGMPTGFQDDALALQLSGGRKARLDYAKIQAVAVAEVRGLAAAPVVVIDAVLNWSEREAQILNAVRFRSDGFDARMVMEAPSDRDEAFRAFLVELLGRSQAVPLPDPDGVLGTDVRSFESLEAYQREVLQVAS